MNCPNCAAEMTAMTLEAHLAPPVTIDVCKACQAFWFDKYESLKLAASSTLKLLKFIGESSSTAKAPLSDVLNCPRCGAHLRMTHDMQRTTKFSYWNCGNEHGRFIGYLDFLREKNFIRPLSPKEIADLRQKIQNVNCSNCGAAIDLATGSVCAHCGSPISILDMNQPQQMLNELKQAAEPRAIDPMLQADLELAQGHVEHLFKDDSSPSLVHAGLSAFAEWLAKSGVV